MKLLSKSNSKVMVAHLNGRKEQFILSARKVNAMIKMANRLPKRPGSILAFLPAKDAVGITSIPAIKIVSGVKSSEKYVAVFASSLEESCGSQYPSENIYSMQPSKSLSYATAAIRNAIVVRKTIGPRSVEQIQFHARIHEANSLLYYRRKLLSKITHLKSINESELTEAQRKTLSIQINSENRTIFEFGLNFDLVGYLKVQLIRAKALKMRYTFGLLGHPCMRDKFVLP